MPNDNCKYNKNSLSIAILMHDKLMEATINNRNM